MPDSACFLGVGSCGCGRACSTRNKKKSQMSCAKIDGGPDNRGFVVYSEDLDKARGA